MINGTFHLAFIGPGGPEILLVMLALLVMFGAKDAPRILRKITDIMDQIRSTAENFKREVMYSDIQSDASTHEEEMGDYDDYGLAADDVEEDEPGESPADTDGEDHDKPV